MADEVYGFSSEDDIRRIKRAVLANESSLGVQPKHRARYPIADESNVQWGKLKVDQTAPYENVAVDVWTKEYGNSSGENAETISDPVVTVTARMPEKIFYQGNRVALLPCSSLGSDATHIAIPLQCADDA